MQRLLAFPADHVLYVGHDYPPDGRAPCSCATVAEQRSANKHVKVGTDEALFIQWRQARDEVLGTPRLLHPSLQVNVRAGKLPPQDEEGRGWMRIPVRTDDNLQKSRLH